MYGKATKHLIWIIHNTKDNTNNAIKHIKNNFNSFFNYFGAVKRHYSGFAFKKNRVIIIVQENGIKFAFKT